MTKTEVLKKCFGFMDLTTLRPEDTVEGVKALVDKVTEFHKMYPSSSACIYLRVS